MGGTVLVTGGTGYIAGELIDQLLGKGWTMRTTVRSNAKSEGKLRKRWPDAGEQLSVFEAELMDDAGWAEATAGCTHVAHVASPIAAAAPKHEDEMIVPAREGTLRALRFARDAGVTRFVQTSSMAAVAYGRAEKVYTVSEKDWTNVDHPDVYPYVKSKTIAERAARDWVAAEGGGIEFVSVNPSMVLGPVHDADFSPSVEVVKQLLNGSMPMAPDLGFAIVDTRDCADLHVRCLETPGLAGERFLASGRFYKMIEVARILRDNLPPEQTRKVPTRVMPNWMVSILALVNPGVRSIKAEIGKSRNVDFSHAKERLGWATRPEAESIVDCAKSLIAHGVVKV
ncbi:3 beta-hydroxysteroid dehydrogenase/Delta 5--_4-isomerase [Tsuneonella dongtanensis]|uniref:3 beta-hydroxysteroid dehydrogenase/Delta 5-->4-isomerase n=1 Tax=Tsuneonella dongtanensis TaxID=692370 RepID=A0A1B2AE23_9SPHN|nr:NAD-dependent epimerase/dehydratase family protein [Tsuneonella dongtanensis]ANY20394.1 3 beta-hydroxysteroid dehydrogenase/Delta 5-->4-isomerase [Tsuneonella dongtanensis]